MKVAAYTIALNEEQFVKRWFNSVKDADYLLIADTGSIDGTVEAALSLGINITRIRVSPWRFDDARNAALAALPIDIDMCISLDMDEVIIPNWRNLLEAAWNRGITRPIYKYIWSWQADGSPGLELINDRIHTRKNYRWRHPVHECLYAYSLEEKREFIEGLEIHHYPDHTKSRAQYLSLMKLTVQEEPESARYAFYYGRELHGHGYYQQAVDELKRYLLLSTAQWPLERSTAMRFIGKSLPEEAEQWFRKAIEEAPGYREPWVDLAQLYYRRQDWQQCLECAEAALSITLKPLEDHFYELEAWGSAPYDYASIAAYHLGMLKKAAEYAIKAVKIEPNNERLKNNLKLYLQALNGQQDRSSAFVIKNYHDRIAMNILKSEIDNSAAGTDNASGHL